MRNASRSITVVILCHACFSICTGQDVQRQNQRQNETAELVRRLDAQAAEIRELRERLDGQQLDDRQPEQSLPVSLQAVTGWSEFEREAGCAVVPMKKRVPVEVEHQWTPGCATPDIPKSHRLNFYADYDRGFLIRPFDPQRHPFELKTNMWIQFRHHAFRQDADSWTDNAGVTRPLQNRNIFDIERGRVVFSGYALDKRLTYFLHLDGDTDGAHAVDFFDYWWAWQFTDDFQVQFGKRKVTAVRQWLLGARRTRFVDRPLANDFFRPDRTVGLFGIGKIGENGHYEVMVGNGYQTANLPETATDDEFTFAVTNYFDPLEKYGGQIVDYGHTSDPLVRIGHSFVFSPQSSRQRGTPLPETNFLRLSDGTRVNQPGALAPGVTVSDFDLFLYGIDAALKWRGWSVNAEAYFRWIEQLAGNGPLPITGIYQHGYYVEGGYFLVPQKFDVNLRYSQVSGEFGDASEYAAGCNWYPLDSPYLKVSFDVTSLDGSPLQNTTSDILVGDDGLLFRTQVQAEF